MKLLTALALAFFLTTFSFVVVHNVVHHEDEPAAVLPGSAGAQIRRPTTTAAPAHAAVVPMRIGATSFSNIADGRNEASKLVASEGTGDAVTRPSSRSIGVRAASNGSRGRSVWFALLGSDLTITPVTVTPGTTALGTTALGTTARGTTARGTAVIRLDGVSWHGLLVSDGGTASVEIRLQVQNRAGDLVANIVVTEATQSTTGTLPMTADNRSVSAEVPVSIDTRTEHLRAYIYVKVDAQGGSGHTAADFITDGGVAYQSIAIAIGQPPPPTTAPAATAPIGGGSGITAAQLAQHSSPESCWLLIQGKVYDVSVFLPKHPGSQLPVLKMCGKESTEAFLTQGGRGSRHSYDAVDKLTKFYIGDYVG